MLYEICLMKNKTPLAGYNFNKYFILALLTVMRTLTAAGQSYPVVLKWNAPVQIIQDGESIMVPVIEGAGDSYGLPYYSFQQKIKNGSYQLSYADVTSEAATATDLQAIQRSLLTIGEIKIGLNVGHSKNESFLQAGVFPYFMENGSVKRITGFTINAVYNGKLPAKFEKDYVLSSVLGAGDWYKISVEKDGVYKIDKAFLTSCGINVENLDPNSINIYGNADGRLSEANNDPYFDDLTKNAIRIVGDADGTFDAEDYIVFYGAGPNRWDYLTASGFERNQHIYSSVNCYFIHIDATDAPLRIAPVAPAGSAATDFVSTYDYIDIHEVEKYNLVKGGQRWYGELFDGDLTQTITFSVPDVVLESPITAQYGVASNASGAGNTFSFALNGTVLKVQSLSFAGLGDYGRNTGTFTFNAQGASIPLAVTLNRLNAGVKGYLDLIEITAKRQLKVMGSQFQFRDLNSVGIGNTSQFTVSGMTTSHEVWDVTNKRSPGAIVGTLSGGSYAFVTGTDSLREFIAFNGTNLPSPVFVKAVQNQNLHALAQADYLIVTPSEFTAQAQRLASLHEQAGLTVHVVTTEQVYNEYSSGVQDATAIRRFAKMFYDRANGDPVQQPKHLLLFGDATYDPKNRVGNNNYYVPSYEVVESENHIYAMVTDDYFGLLDDTESISSFDLMDIGVGRLLISKPEHAVEQVNKIEHYMKNGSSLFSGGPNDCCTGVNGVTFGDWRLNYSIIADDEQGGSFISTDAEQLIAAVQAGHPEMNYDKIYCDAYTQTSTAGGQRYPDVFNAITDRVQRGSLIVNYIGHGGEVGAAEERIITIPQIQSWTNIDKLSLFVTATCEFTKFDDPGRVSAGEWVSLNPLGGAIALMTTTRSVYVSVNSQTIASFYGHVFERDANNDALAFGEILRLTKNTSGSDNNRRCFSLIGDPALKIALPKWRIVTDSINHMDPAIAQDTIRALSKMNVKGHIVDYSGATMTAFNGVLSPTIYDKEKNNVTLGNDNSPIIPFKTQTNALYKGKASVVNGYFSFDCIVPKDINFSYGPGKISYYAQEIAYDADGYDVRLIVGGIDTTAVADNQGPQIDLYLNDNEFVNGGITSQTPVLVVDCFDENGINTVGNGVGHDLVAILDGNSADPIVLNNYYTGSLDTYQSGKVLYTLRELSIGNHTLDVKIWDVNNNSSTARVEFVVVADAAVTLNHVLNYPNPFTTHTTFYYEHNQSCSSLETQIQIYTVTGRLVKTINKLVPTQGFRAEGIDWDGTDDFGDQLAKGVYVYRLSVELPEGGKADKLEKLVLLR